MKGDEMDDERAALSVGQEADLSGVPVRSLRGKCKEYAEVAVAADPTLRLVRGWYIDPIWGRQEHWWTERPDGSIFDPTSRQFPMGGVVDWYEEYQGVFPCEHCGTEVREDSPERYEMCCSGRCYGRMVGVSV